MNVAERVSAIGARVCIVAGIKFELFEQQLVGVDVIGGGAVQRTQTLCAQNRK